MNRVYMGGVLVHYPKGTCMGKAGVRVINLGGTVYGVLRWDDEKKGIPHRMGLYISST